MSKYYTEDKMDCPYALREEAIAGNVYTKCDCPGGCEYKIETSKTGKGIIGTCGKIIHHSGKGISNQRKSSMKDFYTKEEAYVNEEYIEDYDESDYI